MSPLEAFLDKKYKLASSEKFDEFMKASGVGMLMRKMGNSVSPVIDLKKVGDEYVLTTSSPLKTTVTKFKPGVQFNNVTPDGRKVKTTYTIEGTTIHETQIGADGRVTTIDHTWTDDDELRMVLKIDDITCIRIFKLQA